jgi:hypothetical protein
MNDDAIEPSEIITGKEAPKQAALRQNPWLRLIARLFDYALFFTLIHFTTLMRFEPSWLPLEFLAWVPFEAFLLWSWGTTPGKWLLGIELYRMLGKRFSWEPAFRRSFYVWFRGLGMGIPVINVLCALVSYHRLKTFHATSWDQQEGITVVYRPLPKWRLYVTAVLAFIGLSFYSYWKNHV